MDVREAMSELLLALGYEAREFASAEAFLDERGGAEFDCLITDLRMPGASGFDLIERLRADGSEIPVIVVTACESALEREHGRRLGMKAWLGKPVSEADLLRHVRAALAGPPEGSSGDGR